MKEFIQQLPPECQTISIAPRHKVALEHYTIGSDVWVVLLTLMPGDAPKAWRLGKGEYWQLQPKHGTRDRYIRENYAPTITGKRNPPKSIQLSLL